MEAWRIVKSNRASEAFSGEGAYLNGGRFNSMGTPMVYLSGTLSLAALEVLVHLSGCIQIAFSTFCVCFDKSLTEKIDLGDLPDNWRSEPPPTETQMIGDKWVREARSAVLSIPSSIIPRETNFLLNPLHPDFTKIEIGLEEPFAFNPRLLKTKLK